MKDIKTVGDYVATVVFHKEVKVEVPVSVVAEGVEAPAKEAEETAGEATVAEAPATEAAE